MGKKNEYDDEEMTVELELENGEIVNCAIVTILTVESKDYIALLPLNDEAKTKTTKYGSTDTAKILTIPTKSLIWAISMMMTNMKR